MTEQARTVLAPGTVRTCPFCGSTRAAILRHEANPPMPALFCVVCEREPTMCAATGPMAGSAEAASQLWNKALRL
jgi:hypothetical protein